MKINKRSNTSKKIVVALTLSLVVAGGALGVYAYTHRLDQPAVQKPHIDLNAPTSDQIKAGTDIKKQSVENAVKPDNQGSASEQSSGALATQITTASVMDGTLYIRNNIDGIYQDGACTLTLTKDKSVLTFTSGVQALPQSSTCKGFNIKTSQLTAGTWAIKITVVIGDKSATATGDVKV